jgi:dephospho-CoA kinase
VVGFVGVTGLAGSGKTTAAKHLAMLTGGQYLYLGQTVIDEVRARGLAGTPENEHQVRLDLRRAKGRAAFAIPHVDRVAECVGDGIPVFVDAIFVQEEFDVLASRVPSGSARLLAIDASFAIRSTRLSCRAGRPFSADQLAERDNTELKVLGTAIVINAAEYTIRNEETLDGFYRRLAAFMTSCG